MPPLFEEVVYVIAKRKKWKLHYGIRPVGKTTDGKIVVRGLDVFKLTESLGIDLATMLEALIAQNKVVDWAEFIDTAFEARWTIKRILLRVEDPIIDVYGVEYWKEMEKRIRMYVAQQYNLHNMEP